MKTIASQTVCTFNLFFLFLLPGHAFASESTLEDYFVSKPLVLEVRYCECEATQVISPTSDLLPSFLKESSLIRAGVSVEDKGFVSSNQLSLGYEFRPVTDSPGKYHFNYVGSYSTNTGQGRLLLVESQWVNLFGSHHEDETGSQHSNVAVRLAKPSGS